MYNRLLCLAISFVLLVSCQREVDLSGAPDIKAMVDTESETRTSLSVDESGAGTIYWNPADKIDVFFGTAKASYTSQNTSDAVTAMFQTTDSVSGIDISSDNIWGLYPANSSARCDGNSVTTVLSSTQKGIPNSFDDDLFLAIAHSSSTNLQFYNVCGGIRFNLAYDDIKKVTFSGNNGEDLAGDVSITFENGVPKATVVNGIKEITLTPKTGNTFTKGTDYYITLLPCTLSAGFTMTFTTTDGSVAMFNYSESSVTIKRSIFSKKGNIDVYASFGDQRRSNNVIYYTSSDGNIVTPTKADSFGANLVSNDYADGRGVMSFDGDVTSIGLRAFEGCSTLTGIVIPHSVTGIGSFAFRSCYQLTNIDIPDSVTSLEDHSFLYCFGLTSIEIPNSILSIGYGAFNGCSHLTSIRIPDSVISIGHNPFEECINLASIVVDSGNTKYDSRNSCNAIIESETNQLISGCMTTVIPNSVTSIAGGAFSSCRGLTSIVIPNSVTSIGMAAFSSCSGLEKLVIPNSVTEIGYYAFASCSGLTSIEIPYSVTSMGLSPFEGCTSLISIVVDSRNPKYDSRNDCNAVINSETNELISGCKSTVIPNSVTSIGSYAFYMGHTLTSIEIPNSVTSIGSCAFCACSILNSVTVYAVEPPSLGIDAFRSSNNCLIYVPASSVDAYKSAWSEYADRIHPMEEITESVDLGLSVKWATCNLGATEPEGYGDYYAWGETEPYYSSQDPLTWKEGKTGYNWASYQWCNGSSNNLTRYCPSDKTSYWGGPGTPDGKTEFKDYNYADDAARQNLGGNWRTPTDSEWTELRINCTWTWTTQNGVNGYRVASNKTGYTDKSIFLPAAGTRGNADLGDVGSYGRYWSSSLSSDHPYSAWIVYFYSGYVGYVDRSYGNRFCGFSVRPVSK